MKTVKPSDFPEEGTDPEGLPREKTRIEPSPHAPRPSATAAGSKPSAAAAPASRRDVIPITSASKHLPALQSLSMNKSAAPAPQPSGGGTAQRLPWILLGVVLAAGGAYLALSGSHGSKAASTNGPPVRVEVVQPSTPSSQSLQAAGYIAARVPITVGVPVTGRIKNVLVTEGDRVKRNQVLALLDDSQAHADLVLANAKKHDAERVLARTRKLLAAQAATQSDLENAIGKAEIARAELAPILQRVEQAKVRSPIDGTIIEVIAHPGTVIFGNAGVVKMADFSQLVAEVDVNEADLDKVRLHQGVDVLSEAFPDRPYHGQVGEIAQQADRARGTVMVKVYLQVPDQSLRPGMSVKITFLGDRDAKPRLLLPRKALVQGAVWVVGQDGTVSSQRVSTQLAGPDSVEVTGGLKGGERVVVDGADTLHSGQKLP